MAEHSRRDYEEYHETAQELKQSQDEAPVCPYGNRERCPWLYASWSREEWGIEWDFECRHPDSVADDCPLDKEDGGR